MRAQPARSLDGKVPVVAPDHPSLALRQAVSLGAEHRIQPQHRHRRRDPRQQRVGIAVRLRPREVAWRSRARRKLPVARRAGQALAQVAAIRPMSSNGAQLETVICRMAGRRGPASNPGARCMAKLSPHSSVSGRSAVVQAGERVKRPSHSGPSPKLITSRRSSAPIVPPAAGRAGKPCARCSATPAPASTAMPASAPANTARRHGNGPASHHQQPRDQVSADREEHIHAHEAAVERAEPGVEQDHRQHRHRPQAVYLRSIGRRQCRSSTIGLSFGMVWPGVRRA